MSNYDKFVQILEGELISALGCTDPASIAYAASLAAKYAEGETIESIHGEYSGNLIKNALAVNIPGADGHCGAVVAAAIGALAGNSDLVLEVLKDVSPEDVEKACKLIDLGKVTGVIADTHKKLFMSLTVKTDKKTATVVIEDGYTNISEIYVDGRAVKSKKSSIKSNPDKKLPYGILSLGSIIDFVENVPLSKLSIVREGMDMNRRLTFAALGNEFGLSIGEKLEKSQPFGEKRQELDYIVPLWTYAAVEARMTGCSLPAMSNVGSGNQGIMSMVPLMAANEVFCKDEEILVRSVALSCLATIYIKHNIGPLSTVCSGIIACTASGMGMVYLNGGNKEHMIALMKNMFGNLSGMICDGAKATCALKGATCVQAACMSYRLAMAGFFPKSTDGIVGTHENDTIDNFVKTSTEGLSKMDEVILGIIMAK